MLALSTPISRRTAIRAFFFVLALSTVVGAQTKDEATSADQSSESARRLWEEAVAAKGGRERLRNVSSLFVKSELDGGDRGYTLYVFPDYSFDYGYIAKKEITGIQIINAKRGITWSQSNGHPAHQLRYDADNAYTNLLPQFLYLLVTRDIDPTPLRSRKGRVGLRRADVVEVDASGWRVDYYLDPDTHLPIKLVLPGSPKDRDEGKMDYAISLEDYADVGGLMMPRRATHSFTFNHEKWKERLTFEINPNFDKGIFEKPPTAKMGAEAWRPKASG